MFVPQPPSPQDRGRNSADHRPAEHDLSEAPDPEEGEDAEAGSHAQDFPGQGRSCRRRRYVLLGLLLVPLLALAGWGVYRWWWPSMSPEEAKAKVEALLDADRQELLTEAAVTAWLDSQGFKHGLVEDPIFELPGGKNVIEHFGFRPEDAPQVRRLLSMISATIDCPNPRLGLRVDGAIYVYFMIERSTGRTVGYYVNAAFIGKKLTTHTEVIVTTEKASQ